MFSSAKTDDSGQASTEQVMGIFKGIIEVENVGDKMKVFRLIIVGALPMTNIEQH